MIHLFKIKDWDAQFENASSRKLKLLAWVPIPNGHDSVAYARLMTRKDGPQIFAAWILMVQLASRCSQRGTLASSDGRAYTAEEIAVKTRAPESLFTKAIPILVKSGWVECEPPLGESANVLGESANVVGDNGRLVAANRIERNGIEKKTNPQGGWGVIYDSYPRKVGKADAQKAISQAIEKKGYEPLLESVKAYAQAVQGVEKRFIPYPGTWFRAGHYDDDPSEWGVNANSSATQPQGNNTPDALISELERKTKSI